MASMNKEIRAELVRSLRLDSGQAETNPDENANFFPVAEHLRALDPNVVLIVGDRGAGKSKLVSIATNRSLRTAVTEGAAYSQAVSGDAEWRVGFPLQLDGPDAAGWEHFASQHEGERTAVQELWFSYLARTLAEHMDAEAKKSLAGLIQCAGGDAEACFGEFRKAGTSVLLAIDRLDRVLEQSNAWIFVSYDELDTILFSDWAAMGIIIRGLISFWASYSRRWKRVRAKIFLRTDFYRHHSDVVGADIAKLSANRVELSWSDKNLYGMLIKQIANKSPELFSYCKRAGIAFDQDPILKHTPLIVKAEDARPFVERLVGSYMGASEKKGQSFTWILDHIRDGNGKASPRLLVWLIEIAADIESGAPRASGTQLLHPISLRNALDQVSLRHVEQARTNEFRWLSGFETRLTHDREVPWTRKELEKLLRRDWDESWSLHEPNIRPPADNPRELVDYLVELGIVRDRGRESFDVPDLFLAGLNLRRKGGVARK